VIFEFWLSDFFGGQYNFVDCNVTNTVAVLETCIHLH